MHKEGIMLRMGLIVVCLALAFTWVPRADAGPGDIQAGVFGGAGVPTGHFGRYWDPGLTLGAWGDYMVTDKIGVGVDFSYIKNNASDEYIDEWGDLEAEFTYVVVGARATWWFPTEGMVDPYLLGGIGLYNVKEEWGGDVGDEVSQTAVGARLGAGASFAVNENVGITLEASFHVTSTDEEEIGHDTTPYIGVRGGVSYRIPTQEGAE
jgi:opacity protein-like surface antigen